MADIAKRDLVWDAVLCALVSNTASIRIHDVKHHLDSEDDISDRTVRRTLNAMETLEWLSRESERGQIWFPGPRARKYLCVPSIEQPLNRCNHSNRTNRWNRRRPGSEPNANKEIEDAVEGFDVRADGAKMARRRRTLLENIFEFIRHEKEVKPSEIIARFYPGAECDGRILKSPSADDVGYGTDYSWWKNFVYRALSDIDLVETGGKGAHTWFYVGEE